MKISVKVVITALLFISLTVPVLSTYKVEAAVSSNYDNVINGYILKQALCSVGQYGGQCKAWVYQTVRAASDKYLSNYCSVDSYWPTRELPQTLESGTGWASADFVFVVGWGTRALSNAYWLRPGNIVQFAHTALGGITPHTIIIQGVSLAGFTVIDSNWSSNEMVKQHLITKAWLDKYSLGWTGYQIR